MQHGRSGPEFLAASGADVVIEAGPSNFRTGEPGIGYIRSALSEGRDVIVISKGALVYGGRSLRDLATASGLQFKISGATAAALPTIDLIDYALKGCKVLRIEGILNATSNYILDAMMARRIGFETALNEAREAGVAESDPRNDVEGWDTACKLLILANLGLNTDLTMEDIPVAGIDLITVAMTEAWRNDGKVPKLIGSLWYEGDQACASVGIRTFPSTDPLAHVSGKNKAIRIGTDMMGDVIAMGCGSEPIATAAAALKDLEHILSDRLLRSDRA